MEETFPKTFRLIASNFYFNLFTKLTISKSLVVEDFKVYNLSFEFRLIETKVKENTCLWSLIKETKEIKIENITTKFCM